MWDYASDTHTGYHEVADSYGIRPEQMVDYLGLAGDSVDNIPGAPGVGAKTASALLQYFDSVDDLYSNLERVADIPVRGAGKLGARLAEHQGTVRLSRDLAQIRYDVPLEVHETALARQAPDLDGLNSVYDGLGFGDGLRRQAVRIVDSF